MYIYIYIYICIECWELGSWPRGESHDEEENAASQDRAPHTYIIHIHVYAYNCTCMYMCVCVYIYICTYTYM